jgi:4-amino-4-deoxy-L-arabinose transferase-like glycosyltransferase
MPVRYKEVESPMCRSWIKIGLTVLCLVALVARIGADVQLKAWRQPAAMEHRTIARSLVHGTGFTFSNFGYYGPSSVQSPPFPFLLAGMYEIFGADEPADGSLTGANRAYFAIMILNAFAGALLVWLTYLMTRTLGGTPLAGLIAAGLVAIWPTQIYAARFVQAVSFITCGLAAMIILYHRAMRTGNTAPWVGFSFVAAIVALTEPVFLPALLLITGLMFISKPLPWSARFRNLAIQAFAIVAIIGPWATRNYIVHGKLIPVKGSFWVNVWKGNNDYATGSDRLALTPAEKEGWQEIQPPR